MATAAAQAWPVKATIRLKVPARWVVGAAIEETRSDQEDSVGFRTIIVQLDFVGSPQRKLKYAISLAEQYEAKLIGFAAHEIPIALLADGGGTVILQEMDAINGRLSELEAEFRRTVPPELLLEWRSAIGPAARLLASESRSADLVVAGSSSAESAGSIDLGTLILSAGRPVLLAAAEAESVSFGRVLVAWKETREARRAVRDALPLLRSASDVVVATVPGGSGEAETAEDVVVFLTRHGIHARIAHPEPIKGSTAESLVSFAREIAADLIVAGAYGHSRLREWAFGGVTQSLLHRPDVNRFMAN
jgi:nucleotide-binding universal stress UspA family protein